MKIEKINENQIRCTLTAEDLASMKLKLSELTYGSKRAQELFRRMMQEARNQFGFEAENVPLMIEAIPMKADSLVLIVTKIDYLPLNPDFDMAALHEQARVLNPNLKIFEVSARTGEGVDELAAWLAEDRDQMMAS